MPSFLTDPRYDTIRSLAAAIACAAVCGCVFGFSMPLISLRLEHMTGSALLVGLNGAAAALSTIVMAPLVPRLMAGRAPRQILVLSLIAAAALFIMFPTFPDVIAWFVLRFLVGCFMTVIFVISESWINQIVSPERRAFMLGIYGTALSGGFGVGGLVFTLIEVQSDMAFWLGGAMFLIGIIPLTLLQGPPPVAPERDQSSLAAMVRTVGAAPAAIGAGLAFGALETLIFSMMPVYGERMAFSHASIGLMVFAIAMGGIAFQIPLGWVADRTSRRATLFWIAAIATITPVLVWQAGADLGWVLPLLFLQAGVASGLYTVGLSLLGERFTGGGIAAANAAFIFSYGMGSLIAPPVAGTSMDQLGPGGLLLVLGGLAGGYAVFLLVTRKRAAPGS